MAASVGTDQLLGGPGSRPASVDALAARTLVKGEALAPPAGRADDFAWPRREVGREQAKGDSPVASVAPDGTIVQPGQRPPQCDCNPVSRCSRDRQRCRDSSLSSPGNSQQKQPPRPAQTAPATLRDLFGGFGNTAPRRVRPRRRRRSRGRRQTTPRRVRRPLSGRSASVPADNTTR